MDVLQEPASQAMSRDRHWYEFRQRIASGAGSYGWHGSAGAGTAGEFT